MSRKATRGRSFMDDKELVRLASEALLHAYAPYSKFRVGACAVTPGGQVYCGCNVENASLGLTICAERSAIFAAVAGGHSRIDKVVVVSDRRRKPPLPCGACLQVMNEFGVKTVLVGPVRGPFRTYAVRDLLPKPFKFKH